MRERCAVCTFGGEPPKDLLFKFIPPERRAWLEQIHPRLACQSAVAELLLRLLLSEETGLGPAAFVIERTPGEKPRCGGLEFSLSHTDGAVAAAVAGSAVGVDIERIRAPRLRAAASLFTPSELEYMRGGPEARFWELWTRHEAVFKQGGRAMPLGSYLIGGYALSICGSLCEPELLSLEELALRLRAI